MKITHYLYNTFVIESKDKKLAIDPGGLFLYYFRLTTLIPKSEWESITHIFVTHGDPDHHWHTDRVAKASDAPIICNKTMIKKVKNRNYMLAPRRGGLAYAMPLEKFHTLSVDETIEVDNMKITGIQTTHGPLKLKLGPFSKTVYPGPTERIGRGSLGFKIQLHGKTIVNLGDTLFQTEWKKVKNPDVLMIPIGGKIADNTMDENDALKAVKLMKPKLVIPCHYNCPAFFSKKYNPADDKLFKREVEKRGIRCEIMNSADSIEI